MLTRPTASQAELQNLPIFMYTDITHPFHMLQAGCLTNQRQKNLFTGLN